jgi:hypothetical protein
MNVRKIRCLACLLVFAAAVSCAEGLRLVLNPYEDVKWGQATQHKANLYTHTLANGGRLSLAQVFAGYAERGYTVLAITDHDLCTRWEKEKIDPLREFGILPVMGQEYSRGEHINGFFVNYKTRTRNMEFVIQGIAERGGLAVINHPGRYWKPDGNGQVPERTRDGYLRVLKGNPEVLGIEVINKDNRHPHDVMLWDALLSLAMPERPVWGFANDDLHESKHFGYGWNVFLLEALDETSLRRAMLKGQFYFCWQGSGYVRGDGNGPPVIQSVVHDPAAQTLTLSAAADGAVLGAEHYRWIADGQTVCEGPVLKYGQVRGIGTYVRAEMEGRGGKTYTNPFGFR